MHDELSAPQRAISLRLAGRPVKHSCAILGRSQTWFHKWWGRYLADGHQRLYDRTRSHHHLTRRIPPELERALLSVRRRLQAHATPATRYSLIGAPAIRAELQALGLDALPAERTIERVLERNSLTAPRIRLAPLLPRQQWPSPVCGSVAQTRAEPVSHRCDPTYTFPAHVTGQAKGSYRGHGTGLRRQAQP